MNGVLLLGLAGGAALLFSQKENVEAAVTQNLQPDAYTRWDSLFKKYGNLYGVDWMLLKAICWVESDLGRAKSVAAGLADPDSAVDNSGDGKSWGLMQVTLPTAADFRPGTLERDLNFPEISVELGAKIMARNIRVFPGNLEYQVRAYNGGPGFLKTSRGISDTPKYWAKVKKKLELIQANGG